MSDSDRRLVERFVDCGDQAAFTALVERHRDRLRRLLWPLFNGNRDDVDDAEQEMLVALYRDLHHFRHQSPFATFLHRFARNKAIDLLRRKERERRNVLAFASKPRAKVDPQEVAPAEHDEELALAAVMALPRLDRELALMQESEGVSIGDISEVSGLRPGTVKSRLHRARKRLAEELRAMGIEL